MASNNQIKEAFQKVKEDISSLNLEIVNLKKELIEIQNSISILLNSFGITKNQQSSRQTDQQTDTSTHKPTQDTINPTLRHINTTEKPISTHSSTDNYPLQSLKHQNTNISIGNRGVSTDRQTDQQTDTSTGNRGVSTHSSTHFSSNSMLINQLDTFKEELRLKFKRLTNQEMLIFSSIYQFEEQGFFVDYSLLSSKLNLSESSIRDYVQRIIAKGIILDKEKVNNKRVILHIPQDLRKLTSLDTLIKLREI